MNNWNLIGHEWAVKFLAQSVATDRVAHAYLVTGAHGIGKTTLARALAQALQCTRDNKPCGECNACRQVATNRHLDVQMIEGVPPRYNFEKDSLAPPRASDREKRALRILQIRDMLRDVSRAPFEGKHKVVILRRFEEAEEEAANAFLKTLEEPPRYARFILTARDATMVLPTIVSRCQILNLRPLAISEVEEALVARGKAEKDRARLIARLSGGRIGWAVRASADAAMLESRVRYLDELDAVLMEGRAERIARAGELDKQKEELPDVLDAWISWWR
ncbi:MAG: DNA polymerase III subunit, partial [Chloroflexi bacterium]|nr:DNA polymerase III subunit [Chloroflexota bacterium]